MNHNVLMIHYQLIMVISAVMDICVGLLCNLRFSGWFLPDNSNDFDFPSPSRYPLPYIHTHISITDCNTPSRTDCCHPDMHSTHYHPINSRLISYQVLYMMVYRHISAPLFPGILVLSQAFHGFLINNSHFIVYVLK